MFSESESHIEASHPDGISADAPRPQIEHNTLRVLPLSETTEQADSASDFRFDPGCGRTSLHGLCCRASFLPSGKAAPFTTAAHFRGDEIPAIVRFSGRSSEPLTADLLSPAKGMSVQFLLPSGPTFSLIGITVPVFFARTPESFMAMLTTLSRAKEGQISKTEALRRFALHFEESRQGLLALNRLKPPVSYATCLYYCVHAYYLVDEEGRRRPVRFEWLPDAGVHTLTRNEAASRAGDYLERELELRLRERPASFKLNIVFGEEGDPIDDPTKRWPADRRRVEAGRLVLLEAIPEPEGLSIDPTAVPEGIALSEDPILRFDQSLYLEPFRRRTNEPGH